MRCLPKGLERRTSRVGIASIFRQKTLARNIRMSPKVIPPTLRSGPGWASEGKRAPMLAIAKAQACRALNATLWASALAGCSAAPSQSILGSYFPSWMICALIGLLVTIVVRQVFAAVGIDRTLPAPLLVYLAAAVAASFAAWLIWLDRA